MADMTSILRRRPPTATLVGAGLFILGFLLTEIDWRFLALSALGAFGPGILREWGWVRDKDEFQLEAARRAGYHAYLAGGLTALVLVGMIRAAEGPLEEAGELVIVLLAVMWFTWLLSSLFGYWGPQKTVARILVIFGSVWLIFNIVGNIQGGIVALIMQSLLAVPFFLLAWTARRWPRIAGVILLAVSAFFFWFFGLYEVFGPDPMAKGRFLVIVLFIGPLAASGVMLLGSRSSEESGEGEPA